MSTLWRFEGHKGRAAYLLVSLAVFFGQHLVVLMAGLALDRPPPSAWWFWINPFRALLFDGFAVAGTSVLTIGMIATGVADALLVWLAFRRGRWSKRGGWIATLAIVPVVQIGVMAWLTLTPNQAELNDAPEVRRRQLDAMTAALGLLVGIGLIVMTVALSTLVFRIYGYTLFVFAPFLIAVAVGYQANRNGPIGVARTFGLVACAFLIGGCALIGFAMEGLVCLILASPLIAGMGAVGAGLGMALASLRHPGPGTTLSSIAIIPILLAGEAALPPRATFYSVESIEVAAPPSAVWDAVVHMGPIPGAPAPPFRWGLAYPLRGEIRGTGVGSIRVGVFSTGVAYERVTEWQPEKKLSFVVLSDPPSMKELSPYGHVDAPHVKGYFRTADARFTLTPLANGQTRLTLATHHELDLEPTLYWTPIAQWAVHANKVRVLTHFRQQAEASIRGG